MYRGETSLHIALVHHPVINKRSEIIGSAVTNLDIHDIARTARTYGVGQYFITTPYLDQQKLVQELLDHWLSGHGATYNPARREALDIVALAASVTEVIDILTKRYNRRPFIVTTSARIQENNIEFDTLCRKIAADIPILLLFGTAHGLGSEVIKLADGSLPPLRGGTDYNHLSVRSAASVIIDRLLGDRRGNVFNN